MRKAHAMHDTRTRNVLIVANRTAATPALLAEVRRQASEASCRFTLLVPRPFWDDTEESAITLELAIPPSSRRRGSCRGTVGAEDPFLAVSGAVEAESYDQVIISTLPVRFPLAAHRSTGPRGRLGLPVTVVTAKKSDRPRHPPAERSMKAPVGTDRRVYLLRHAKSS